MNPFGVRVRMTPFKGWQLEANKIHLECNVPDLFKTFNLIPNMSTFRGNA